MAKIFEALIAMIPKIRTSLQWALAVLVVAALVTLYAGPETPILPQIFVYAVIPLLISMQMVPKRFPPVLQTIIVLVITLTSLAFLGTGVALARFEKTPDFEIEYRDTIRQVETRLNEKHLFPVGSKIDNVKSYSDYRAMILEGAQSANYYSLISDVETAVDFYERYLNCVRKFQCLTSSKFNNRITDFWYTYRPILEDYRVFFGGSHVAQALQARAETVRPPLYRSEVRRDPVTKKITLVYPEPLRKLPENNPS